MRILCRRNKVYVLNIPVIVGKYPVFALRPPTVAAGLALASVLSRMV